jgi:hypothetical protein
MRRFPSAARFSFLKWMLEQHLLGGQTVASLSFLSLFIGHRFIRLMGTMHLYAAANTSSRLKGQRVWFRCYKRNLCTFTVLIVTPARFHILTDLCSLNVDVVRFFRIIHCQDHMPQNPWVQVNNCIRTSWLHNCKYCRCVQGIYATMLPIAHT